MQSIITKYYGATNTKPSCIRVWATGNPKRKAKHSWNFERCADHNHQQAARTFASTLNWPGVWQSSAYDDKGTLIWTCTKERDLYDQFTIA